MEIHYHNALPLTVDVDLLVPFTELEMTYFVGSIRRSLHSRWFRSLNISVQTTKIGADTFVNIDIELQWTSSGRVELISSNAAGIPIFPELMITLNRLLYTIFGHQKPLKWY